jgi:SAM-dependent methyltransferase
MVFSKWPRLSKSSQNYSMNSEEQKEHWDLKYKQGLTSLTQPDPFFVSAYGQFVDQSFPNAGVALDLACGLGRHALWLASRNWRVSAVDLSAVAIAKLSRAALERNVNLDLLVADAAEYKFEHRRFDLIVLFYHPDRALFPKMVSALKPGGLLISKMSLQWESDGRLATVNANPLGRNELRLLVPELHVLYQEERPIRDRGVVEFVGRKC